MQDEPPLAEPREHFGVLVGWRSQDLGTSMVLEIQTVERASWENGENPFRTKVMMTKGQAAVLANFLLKASGQTPPPRKRGWFSSLFG